MIKKILAGIFLLVAAESFSQTSGITLLGNKKSIGKNLVNQKKIEATEYIFPDRIHNSYIDTTSGLLTIQLRGLSKNGKWLNNKGEVIQYDLNSQKVKWTKKILYQTSNIKQFSNTMIHTVANKSYCLNIENGENKWKVKNDIYFVDPIDNIGIGYKFKSSMRYSNKLEGINLLTGDVIWQKKLNREYSWNDVFYLNDSTLIIVSAGLHAINIKNGEGWDYNTITGKKDYRGTIAANAAGVALGLLTGTFVTSTGHNLVRDVVSNVIVDSLDLYFASKEKLSRINKNSGKVIWSYPFPKGLSSKSTIFLKDSLVYIINKGYAFMGNRQIRFGTPFIAAFSMKSGKPKFFSTINTKKDPILGFKVSKDILMIVFRNRVTKFSIIDGTQIFEKTINTKEFGDLKFFVGNHVYINSNDNSLISLPLQDTTKNYIFTSKSMALELDYEFNVTKQFEYEQLCICYLETDKYKFIAKDNITTILDLNKRKIAEINTSSNATLIGKKLYNMQEKSFLEIDLTELFEIE